MIAALLAVAAMADPWVIETIDSPPGETVEVGGIAFPQDDVIAVSSRRGRVWLIDGALDEDSSNATWLRHADGLYEGLGLDAEDGDLIVLQRGELSRLRDVDGDRVADDIETLSQAWGLSDNYHEYAFGLPRDVDGNRYMSLNLGFQSPEWWHGVSIEPYRGWILRVTPEGEVQPWAHGLRSPCGLGFDAEGRLLATDNQGDWMPSSPIFVVQEGGFHGHPGSLRWTDAYRDADRVPDNREPPDAERVPAAIWIPYDWSRSTGNLVTDATGGRFGPFEDQLFVAELTTGRVLRAEIEDVEGTSQGAVWPFVDRVGSVARVAFAPDGSLVCGLTNRGWGGLAPGSGVKRIRWTGELPLEMRHVRIAPDGFDIEFTKPIASGVEPPQITARSYDYNWWWKYGSPEQRSSELDVTDVDVSSDGRFMHITLPELRSGRVVRLKLVGVVSADGEPLRTEEVAYTINRLPGGPLRHVARRVTAPPLESMSEDETGWLRLTWGEPTELWSGDWRLSKAKLSPTDRSQFVAAAGNDALVNDLATKDLRFRSSIPLPARLRASVMLPRGGAVGFGLPGGASLVARDIPAGGGWLGVIASDGDVLAEAANDTWRGPGQWHELEFAVREGGLDEVMLDDVRVLEGVELAGGGGDWLRVLHDIGPAGVADIRVNAASAAHAVGTSLLPEAMQLTPGLWGGLGASGLSMRGAGSVTVAEASLREIALRGMLRFSSGSSATLRIGDVEIAIAEGRATAATTGSILNVAERQVRLIPPDTWYDLSVRLSGDCAAISLNGVEVARACDVTTGGAVRITLHEGGLDVAALVATALVDDSSTAP